MLFLLLLRFLGSTILYDPQCMYVCMYVRMSVCPEPYNLPNRNRYEKSEIIKKLRIDKIRCNEIIFSKHSFFGLRKIISRKTRLYY